MENKPSSGNNPSRPDIQVLEDRIARIKKQITECTKYKYYSITKQRFDIMYDQLDECMSMLASITGRSNKSEDIDLNSTHHSKNSPENYICPSLYDESDDISDDEFSDITDDNLGLPSLSNYTPREIVCKYRDGLQDCCDFGITSGIIQIGQFCILLNDWYKARFVPDNRNPKFFFKASRIREWLNLFILSAGYSLHYKQFDIFVASTRNWIETLNTAYDDCWVVPSDVLRIRSKENKGSNKEAILIEDMIKPCIYNKEFYPEELHSIRDMVSKNEDFIDDKLDFKSLLESMPQLVVTSTFDITKYTEEDNL